MIGIKYLDKIILINNSLYIGVCLIDEFNINSLSDIVDYKEIEGEILLGHINDDDIDYKMIVRKYLSNKK